MSLRETSSPFVPRHSMPRFRFDGAHARLVKLRPSLSHFKFKTTLFLTVSFVNTFFGIWLTILYINHVIVLAEQTKLDLL